MGGGVFLIFGWSITKMIKRIECIIKLQLHWKYIITIMSLYNFHTLIDVSQFILGVPYNRNLLRMKTVSCCHLNDQSIYSGILFPTVQ